MALRIGEWILSDNEVEDIEAVTLTVDEARELIGSESTSAKLDQALDNAQSPVFGETIKRSFVLICIE